MTCICPNPMGHATELMDGVRVVNGAAVEASPSCTIGVSSMESKPPGVASATENFHKSSNVIRSSRPKNLCKCRNSDNTSDSQVTHKRLTSQVTHNSSRYCAKFTKHFS